MNRPGMILLRVALLGGAVAAGGCPEPTGHRETTTKPAPKDASAGGRPRPASQPAASQPISQPDPNFVSVRVRQVTDPQDGWLLIEAIGEGAPGAWATGRFIPDRRIEIETENVEQFSIDISRMAINWDRRVVLRINGRASELTRKRHPVVHLKQDATGAWNVVKP